MAVRCASLAFLAGCVYHPGSFHGVLHEFPGTPVALGCIDLAVARTHDARATGPVVEYSFGNRCLHAVVVDLAAVRVVERGAPGVEMPLVAYDPRHEIVPLRLDARWRGDERIEYRGGDGGGAVCVEVSGLDRSTPQAPTWICPDDVRGEP